MQEVWERHSQQHPLVRYLVETGDGQAAKFSGSLSEAEYHGLDLYRAFYSELDAAEIATILAIAPGTVKHHVQSIGGFSGLFAPAG